MDDAVLPDGRILGPIVAGEKLEFNPGVVVGCGDCKTTRLGPGVVVVVELLVLTTVVAVEGDEKICNLPSGI